MSTKAYWAGRQASGVDRHQGWPSGRTGSRFTSTCACAPLKAARPSLSATASAVTTPVAAIRRTRRHSYGDRRRPEGEHRRCRVRSHCQKHSVEQVFRARCQDRRGNTGQGIRPGTGPIGVVMSERRNPNPHPPRPHRSSTDTTPSHQHPSYSCTLSHEEPVFDVPTTPDLLRNLCAVPAKATARQNIPACSRVSLQRTRYQSACDGCECPDWIRRQGCVVSVVCGGDVVPSIA
jgi:hypothetical protein